MRALSSGDNHHSSMLVTIICNGKGVAVLGFRPRAGDVLCPGYSHVQCPGYSRVVCPGYSQREVVCIDHSLGGRRHSLLGSLIRVGIEVFDLLDQHPELL